MITFSVALLLLLLGYLFYGTFVEKVFGVEPERKAPCYERADGVDYMAMPSWKVFLIQFLNIAGTGPIFGAIMGILFGPAAYLWIVFGCIFAGAVHDYMVGMLSMRRGGVSLPELVGDELGPVMRIAIRVCTLVLLVLLGAVFVTTPADLIAHMTSGWSWSNPVVWCAIIFAYYVLATILPIDALIGRVYPLFGVALLIMALGVGIGIYTHDGFLPEITDQMTGNHPKGLPLFPMLCITIACGAISGFHATQSPLMARCLTTEKHGRHIFYGAMITEGVVALIWAAAAIKFAGSYQQLADMGTPAVVVGEICNSWLGKVGAVLAVLGVVAAPITSGDTAFRSARLIAADFLHIDQKNVLRRLAISVPLFLAAAGCLLMDFFVLWRYFAWFNQTLACIALWTVTVWLARSRKFFWMTLLPAMFMTVVCSSYILIAPEGFSLPYEVGLGAGLALMVLCTLLFAYFQRNNICVK